MHVVKYFIIGPLTRCFEWLSMVAFMFIFKQMESTLNILTFTGNTISQTLKSNLDPNF